MLCQVCIKCGETKLATNEFFAWQTKQQTLKTACKKCLSAIEKARVQGMSKEDRHALYARLYRSKRQKPGYLARETVKRRRWRQKNLEYARAWHRDYIREKRKTCPQIRMAAALRKRLHKYLGRADSRGRSEALLGCTYEELWAHLRSQYCDGMADENYGQYWEIDHVIPLSAWDLANPAHLAAASHHLNLSPLEKSANRSKGGTNTKPAGYYLPKIEQFLAQQRSVA
jgi:5-methylcytosine-specific restriction endonuclease McrA